VRAGLLAAACVGAALIGCSGGQAGPSNGPAAGDSAGASTEPPADETEYERTVRLAKAKRADCDRLVDAVQAVQEKDSIVGINDAGKMKELAQGIEQQAAELSKLAVSTPELQRLRDDYSELMKERAKTMVHATGLSGPKQKQAVQELKAIDGKKEQLIEEINGFCCGDQPPADKAEPKK